MGTSAPSPERSVINTEKASSVWTNHPAAHKSRPGTSDLTVGQPSHASEITNLEEFLQPTTPSAAPPGTGDEQRLRPASGPPTRARRRLPAHPVDPHRRHGRRG